MEGSFPHPPSGPQGLRRHSEGRIGQTLGSFSTEDSGTLESSCSDATCQGKLRSPALHDSRGTSGPEVMPSTSDWGLIAGLH